MSVDGMCSEHTCINDSTMRYMHNFQIVCHVEIVSNIYFPFKKTCKPEK